MINYEITKLDNGATIISEFIPYVKTFSLGFFFDVGSRDEDLENNGISHFIEHMFFKGTEKRSAKKLSDEIESTGGYLNAFTSKEHTCFYGRGLSKNLAKTYSVLSDMIQNSTFRQSEINKEAGVVIDELYDIEDTPEELIFDKFESNIFSGNSLAYPIIGTEENIRAFSREKIVKYINKYYGFDNLVIVASGYVEHKKLIKLTEKYFRKDIGKTQARRKEVSVQSVKDMVISKEIQQTHMILGTPTFGFNNIPERTAVNILSQILGEGSSSRLFQRIREKNGIAYQINTFLNSFYDISTFGAYISTNEKSFGKARKLIFEEFKKIKSKQVSDQELKRAKEYLKGSILMSMESTTNRMIRMAQSYIYFNKIHSVEESVELIDAVDKVKVMELANLLLTDENLTKVIICSDENAVEEAA
ncbi:MAG: peptidase M16 [Melioribacteraceae bacterium]|nr:MAG: peptidase M16 [Melioribacteraceae bacterium]